MSARELILWPVVLCLCIVALVRPRVGLYSYIWWALMRPDILAFAEGKFQISLIIALATGIGSLPYMGQLPILWRNPITRLLILLQVPLGLSVLFALNPDLCIPRYSYYIRMIAALLLIPVLIQTEEHLRNLLLVMAFSLGFIALRFGLYGVIHGGVELANGYGEMLGDNNFVALAFAMLIPLAWCCRRFVNSSWIKLALSAVALFSIPAIVMSNSRGGILAMMTGLLLLSVFTNRKVLSFVVLAAVLGGAVYSVRDMFVDRMSTLAHPEDEASANSRIVLAGVALEIFEQHPLLGVGFGGLNFAVEAQKHTLDEKQRVAHDTYLQVLVDSGLAAALLYVALLGFTIVAMGRSARFWGPLRPESAAIARGIQISLIAFAVGAPFYSCDRMDWPYMLILCGASWYSISARNAEELPPAGDDEVTVDATLVPEALS